MAVAAMGGGASARPTSGSMREFISGLPRCTTETVEDVILRALFERFDDQQLPYVCGHIVARRDLGKGTYEIYRRVTPLVRRTMAEFRKLNAKDWSSKRGDPSDLEVDTFLSVNPFANQKGFSSLNLDVQRAASTASTMSPASSGTPVSWAGSPVFVASDRGTPVANRASPHVPDERYEGEINQADVRHGAGTLIFSPQKNGRIEKVEAEWDNGEPRLENVKITYRDGSVYEGEVNKKWERNGAGVYTEKTRRSIGEVNLPWKKNKLVRGTVEFIEGELYESGGRVYIGDLKHGLPHGEGKMTLNNGATITGKDWKNTGTKSTLSDGVKLCSETGLYSGSLKGLEMHGIGRIYFDCGGCLHGSWKDGAVAEWFTVQLPKNGPFANIKLMANEFGGQKIGEEFSVHFKYTDSFDALYRLYTARSRIEMLGILGLKDEIDDSAYKDLSFKDLSFLRVKSEVLLKMLEIATKDCFLLNALSQVQKIKIQAKEDIADESIDQDFLSVASSKFRKLLEIEKSRTEIPFKAEKSEAYRAEVAMYKSWLHGREGSIQDWASLFNTRKTQAQKLASLEVVKLILGVDIGDIDTSEAGCIQAASMQKGINALLELANKSVLYAARQREETYEVDPIHKYQLCLLVQALDEYKFGVPSFVTDTLNDHLKAWEDATNAIQKAWEEKSSHIESLRDASQSAQS